MCNNIAIAKCAVCKVRLCIEHRPWHGHTGTIFIPDEKHESFSSLLSFQHTLLMDKIHALRVFNEKSSHMIDEYLASEKEKLRNKIEATLSEDEKTEYDLNLSVDILSLSAMPKPTHIVPNQKIARLFAEETVMYNHREHIRRASKESVLVYLVIVFEEFLSNLLRTLFSKRLETLKDSDKHILFKDAVEYTDISELVETMSKREAKDIVETSIEDLGYKLGKKFHLYLDRRDDWDKFKEIFHRRNIIVHNYGFPDSTYAEKTKFKGEMSYWLEINNTYINEAFSTFENYAKEIANFFGQKYGSKMKNKKKKSKS